MRRFLVPLAASATMLAAACSEPAPAPAQDGATPAATSAATVTTVSPTASPATATAIPEPFRGVWDYAGGSCNPASDLRLEIGAVSIEFYESLGAVTGVTVELPDSIVVDLAMEGEGQRWKRETRYVLSDGGATLTPTDMGGVPAPTPGPAMPRTRCAK